MLTSGPIDFRQRNVTWYQLRSDCGLGNNAGAAHVAEGAVVIACAAGSRDSRVATGMQSEIRPAASASLPAGFGAAVLAAALQPLPWLFWREIT